jgi:hypothetical protein
MKCKWLILLFLLVSYSQAHCQLWFLTRGMPAQDERAWGIDTDMDGNIYWSVEQKDLWPYWYYNISVYKIDPDSRQVWQSPSWGGLFNDIAFVTKVSGSVVYIAGRTDSTADPNQGDVLVATLNSSDGIFNWHYTFDQGFGYEEVDGISIQPDGIYLTGWTQGRQSGLDFLVQKITLDGHPVWSNSWDYLSLGKMDGANGNMAVDDRFIYAAGHVGRTNIGTFDGDMGLACFSRADGALQWNATWGGLLYDDGLGMTMGADSMLYVVGYTGSYGKGSQFYLNKYSRLGQLQWSRLWGGAWAEDSRSVVAGPDGLIYAVGATSSYGSGDYDIFVLKYDQAGMLLDSLIWGGTHKETAHDAALSGDFLYITGETWSFGQGAAAGNGKSDALLLKVNVRTMEGPDNSMTGIREILPMDESLKVFPNPAHESLRVEFYGFRAERLTVSNMSGITVIQMENIPAGPVTLDTGGILPGIYLIKVTDCLGKVHLRKVLIL